MGIGTNMRVLATAGGVAAIALAVDQSSKAAARDAFRPGETHQFGPGELLGVGHVQNRGSAYGLLEHLPTVVPAAVTAVVGAGALAMAGGSGRPHLAAIGAGLLVGGGVGNVVDRLRDGHVIDLLHATPAFGWFNVADVALNVGIGLTLLSLGRRAR